MKRVLHYTCHFKCPKPFAHLERHGAQRPFIAVRNSARKGIRAYEGGALSPASKLQSQCRLPN